MDHFFKRALENVTRYGDTDVFPFPMEKNIFYDCFDEALLALDGIHKDFKPSLAEFPPFNESLLTAVGYTGFRWATQIDPLWNVYFLGLVMAIGKEIESARLPISKEIVFSYRYDWDNRNKTIFNKNIGWNDFQAKSIDLAKSHKQVLVCDISDFYPRIYHHRLENAMQRASTNTEAINRIMLLLKSFSKGVSYGLPVGGQAARLLSELLLNRLDRLLVSNNVTFCRFADDYHVFADSTEDAYAKLLLFSGKLMENEGLLLQKAKTRIMSSEEFLAMVDHSRPSDVDTPEEQKSRKLMSLRLHFDPYSATADEDYEKLRLQVSEFDIISLLTAEMQKARIHQALTKKLISAIKYMDKNVIDSIVISLIESLPTLYPVYPSVVLLIKDLIKDLAQETRDRIFLTIRTLIRSKSYIVSVPTHLAYSVRLLASDLSDETDEILSTLYKETSSILIRRDIILAMANRGADYWISDKKQSFSVLTPWEKTAMFIASYILNDEGNYWRNSIVHATPMDKLAVSWAAKKKDLLRKFQLPL